MARLTIVFEYPDEEHARRSKQSFLDGKIANLVGIELGDALEDRDGCHRRLKRCQEGLDEFDTEWTIREGQK